jgi:hypothetical protein
MGVLMGGLLLLGAKEVGNKINPKHLQSIQLSFIHLEYYESIVFPSLCIVCIIYRGIFLNANFG